MTELLLFCVSFSSSSKTNKEEKELVFRCSDVLGQWRLCKWSILVDSECLLSPSSLPQTCPYLQSYFQCEDSHTPRFPRDLNPSLKSNTVEKDSLPNPGLEVPFLHLGLHQEIGKCLDYNPPGSALLKWEKHKKPN